MLDRLKLKTKIAILVISSLLALVSLTALSINETHNDLIEARKDAIKSVLDGVHSTLSEYHALEKSGELTREEAQKAAAKAISMIRYGGSDGKAEYVYSFTTEGVGIYHIAKARIGKNMLEEIRDPKGNYTWKDILRAVGAAPTGANLYTLTARPGQAEPVPKLQYVKLFEPWSWVLGTGVYVDDIQKDLGSRVTKDLLLDLLIVILIGALGFFIQKSISRQVGGEPSDAIQIMSKISQGDLTIKVPHAPEGSMLHSLSEMLLSLRMLVNEIGTCAHKLSSDAEHISKSSKDVASAAQKQADSTSAMAAAIEEMTVSINHISDNASETQEHSRSSVLLADEGCIRVEAASNEMLQITSTVTDASARIQRLEDRTSEISSIAGVIKDIAGQTNLLALNAAIEAARAGEQGRGFAVVADEVRKLAERTSSATVEIEKMISGIQADTVEVVGVMNSALPELEAGVEAAKSAADTLRKIKDGAQTTMNHSHEVADATKEQSIASTSIAQQVEEVATMVEQTSFAIQSTADIAADMDRISTDLSTLIRRFKI